jgi:hypothetical protein
MCFSCKMCRLEKESAVLEGTIFKNSLLNSLLAGNLGRERLAPDCLLRHAVWTDANSRRSSLKSSRKARQFANFSSRTALERMDSLVRPSLKAFVFSDR